MQGRDGGQRQLLDVESWAGHLLPPGSVFAFLAAHRHELFPDEVFNDLFPSGRGRPSIPADVIASVLVLQTIHTLSDRETADAVTFDLRWKAACGFALTQPAFHPSVLTYWRRRLAASDRPHRIFDAVTEVIAQSGALTGRRRRAVDSTILDDAVARQDTVTQLVAQIRRVGREIPGAAAVVAGLPGHDYSKPGKPDIAWDDAGARDELVSRLVADAQTVLASIDSGGLSESQQEAVALLALVAGQDVEPAEGSDGTDGRWRIARKIAPDRVISTVDPETRHAHKSREKKQDGFRAHIVIEPDTGLVTAAGHVPVIKPMPLARAVPGGFTIDDFTIDEAARTASCPAGVTRTISATGRATFGVVCSSCPLLARCATSSRGRKLEIGPHDRIKREHRAPAKDADSQAVYQQHRPMVERSIGWMTRGARRVPYRGVAKNNAWWATRAAGINLKRLLNLGLRLDEGAWALT